MIPLKNTNSLPFGSDAVLRPMIQVFENKGIGRQREAWEQYRGLVPLCAHARAHAYII